MTQPHLNDIYKQALASLCEQAGGEIVIVIDESFGTLMSRIEPTHEAGRMAVRFKVENRQKPS